MGVRKNQKNLTTAEWAKFTNAIDATHGVGAAAPAYRSFVSVHVDAMTAAHMNWEVHTMMMGGMTMRGVNFLTWHRRFLKLFEERLQQVDPSITIPYWNSVADRAIPAPLANAALLTKWSVTRSWDASQLASQASLNAVIGFGGTFTEFQTALEGSVHAATHNAVGGHMAGASSPTDPVFWLHHSFIDKIWADWQASPNGKNPPGTAKKLKPTNLVAGVPFGVKVSYLLQISKIGRAHV